MRRSVAIIGTAVLLAAVIIGPVKTFGTSYDPFPQGEGWAAPGATVFLFHSGTEDVSRSIGLGDVLAASRQGGDGASRPAGRIRVAATAGAVCFRGEVLEGCVRLHDLATGNGVYCLVVPEAVCGR